MEKCELQRLRREEYPHIEQPRKSMNLENQLQREQKRKWWLRERKRRWLRIACLSLREWELLRRDWLRRRVSDWDEENKKWVGNRCSLYTFLRKRSKSECHKCRHLEMSLSLAIDVTRNGMSKQSSEGMIHIKCLLYTPYLHYYVWVTFTSVDQALDGMVRAQRECRRGPSPLIKAFQMGQSTCDWVNLIPYTGIYKYVHLCLQTPHKS